MSARLSLATLAVFASLTTARAADDGAIKKEMKKLEGKWVVIEREGKKLEGDEAGKYHMVIAGNRFKLTSDGKTDSEGTFTIVEVKGKTRKTDLTFTSADFKGSTFENLAEWIDDDTFYTAVGQKGSRPAQALGAKEKPYFSLIFKRVTKK